MQRKYPLEWFDLFITDTLPTIMNSSVAINAVIIREILTIAFDEKKQVRLSLLEDMFNTKGEKNMQVLINRYQVLLIHLIDEVSKTDLTGNTHMVRFFGKKIRQCLESLLAFIETDFLKYFDLDQRVPESYHAVCRELIARELPELEEKLYGLKQDASLVELVLDNLRSFSMNTKVHLPYRIFLYMKSVWYELRYSLVYDRPEGRLPKLLEILIRSNYNSPALTNYLAETYLPIQLASIYETDGKIKLLHSFKRDVTETIILSTGKLFMDLPGIDEQIMELVNEEIEFLHPPPVYPTNGITVMERNYKINTNLSVPLLAAVFRVFKEIGVIQNGNVKKLLEFVAANYTTLKSEQISYTHLHSSYYDIDPKNKRRLYDLLVQLANTTRKM